MPRLHSAARAYYPRPQYCPVSLISTTTPVAAPVPVAVPLLRVTVPRTPYLYIPRVPLPVQFPVPVSNVQCSVRVRYCYSAVCIVLYVGRVYLRVTTSRLILPSSGLRSAGRRRAPVGGSVVPLCHQGAPRPRQRPNDTHTLIGPFQKGI